MSWWLLIAEYLRSPERRDGGKFNLKKILIGVLAESAVDFLYYIIGLFTTIYFLSAVYLFFFENSGYHELFVRVFDALSEPYLGSVGIYVILKEIRKRNLKTKSRHFGEYFVLAWTLLLLTAGAFIFHTEVFVFDDLMASILTISMALIVIYTGGLVHKP